MAPEILAGYQHLAEQADAFADAAEAGAQPREKGRRPRKGPREAFMAWQAVRFVNFGPIETDNRTGSSSSGPTQEPDRTQGALPALQR